MLSVVIPVYNRAEILEKVITEIFNCLQNKKSQFEIIAVNDGSRDNSLSKLVKLTKTITNLKIINLKKNVGQHQAIFWGMYFAKGKTIITFDCDLEISPQQIIKLLKFKNEYSLISAKRLNRNTTFYRKLFSFIFNKIFFLITKIPLTDYGSPLKVWDKKIVLEILKWGSIPNAVSSFKNFKIGEVKVKSCPSKNSSYNFIKLFLLSFNFIKCYYFPQYRKINLKNVVKLNNDYTY